MIKLFAPQACEFVVGAVNPFARLVPRTAFGPFHRLVSRVFETELNGAGIYKATPSCIPVSSPPPAPILRTQFWSL